MVNRAINARGYVKPLLWMVQLLREGRTTFTANEYEKGWTPKPLADFGFIRHLPMKKGVKTRTWEIIPEVLDVWYDQYGRKYEVD